MLTAAGGLYLTHYDLSTSEEYQFLHAVERAHLHSASKNFSTRSTRRGLPLTINMS